MTMKQPYTSPGTRLREMDLEALLCVSFNGLNNTEIVEFDDEFDDDIFSDN